jgi:glycosyltransferase involved in cell wall biosynthesis
VIRALVNGRFLGQRITGAQRYARELLAAMDACLQAEPALRQRISLTVLVPRGTRPPPLQVTTVREIGRLQGHAWEQLELPWHARGSVLLSLCNTAPLAGQNMVATILDASVYAVPGAYSRAFRSWYRVMIPVVGRRSRRVITISQFSRRELERYAGLNAGKISVVHGSGEHILAIPVDERILDRLDLRARPYVLGVSSRSSHKNVSRVAQAVGLLPSEGFDVVFAGGDNPRVFSDSAGPSSQRVRLTGYVSDGELRALYQHAACFVYPSLYEGFGLPPLEAMTCGCPTIVSRSASLPEICGDAALYCDPADAGDIARRIGDVMASQALREDLRHRGLKQAVRFRWNDAARSVLTLIDELDNR